MDIFEISILIRLIVGAIGTFFAILLWSKTRDVAWILIIVGTILFYIEIVFTTLQRLGIIRDDSLIVFGLPGAALIKILLINAPILIFSIAFIIVIIRKRLF